MPVLVLLLPSLTTISRFVTFDQNNEIIIVRVAQHQEEEEEE